MTQALPVPEETTAPAWKPGLCMGCDQDQPATLPVGEGRMCAPCVAVVAAQQLNREALEAGTASLIPAPASWVSAQVQGLLHCEGCPPPPFAFVSWHPLARMWLDPVCAEEFDRALDERARR